MTKEVVFSVKQVSEMCHVSPETVRRWVRTLGLKAYNTQLGLAMKIPREELQEFAGTNNVFVDWSVVDDE